MRVTSSEVYDLGRLTPNERLVIWRHRQTCSTGVYKFITQTEAARRIGVGRYIYNRMEGGRRTMMSTGDAYRIAAILGEIRPTLGELCFLARRRSSRTLREVLADLDTTRPTFYVMERSGDARVVCYWEDVGFRFGGRDEVDRGEVDGGEGMDIERCTG